MIMTVMQIWPVGMGMKHCSVRMIVAVALCFSVTWMLMLMMIVIVAVQVFMVKVFMLVMMLVLLTKKDQYGNEKQGCRQDLIRSKRFMQEHDGEQYAQKGCARKD